MSEPDAGIGDLQRRTLGTLMASVLPAGAAAASGFSSAALLGKEITGNGAWGTLAASIVTVGATLTTVPLAGFMGRHGRRPGLRRAWSIGAAGALVAAGAAITDFYPLLLLGALAIGVGNAANLTARYAAADLAPAETRARAIGTLVWASSFGSALGPTLGLGVVGSGAEALGLPELAGPYLLALLLFAAAAIFVERRLHPDPLVVAGGLTPADSSRGTGRGELADQFSNARAALSEIIRHPSARLAVTAMVVGHAVMVAVMTATPLHMKDGDHELRIIGFVISLHIVGMYFFAPVVGWLVDHLGARPVIASGGVILFVGAELASHTDPEDRLGVFVGLLLIGLGWSFGLVAGSSLLTGAFAVDRRVAVQGGADLVMSGGGALASLTAGIVYELGDYHDLSHYAGLLALGLTAYAAWRMLRADRGAVATVAR